MSEINQFLEPQAQWQKRRQALSWPDKIRMAEQIRASVAQWRSMAGKTLPAPSIPTAPANATREPRSEPR